MQIVIRELGVAEAGAKITTPLEKEKPDALDEDDEPLPVGDVHWYQSVCMRIAYVAQDRVDLGATTREVAKGMKTPTKRHDRKLKRAGRYLRIHPRMVQYFRNQESVWTLEGWCGADRAGCIRTRKSTTGVVIMLGKYCVAQ